MVRGDFSPISVRSSGDATTAAALMIMEVENQVEQERAEAAELRAKATASRIALLKAQAEGSPSGGSLPWHRPTVLSLYKMGDNFRKLMLAESSV